MIVGALCGNDMRGCGWWRNTTLQDAGGSYAEAVAARPRKPSHENPAEQDNTVVARLEGTKVEQAKLLLQLPTRQLSARSSERITSLYNARLVLSCLTSPDESHGQ